MSRFSKYESVGLGIVAKSLGALYGILAMGMFQELENLNLWIISCYVGSIITLANIIIIPEVFTSGKDKTKIENLVHGTEFGFVFKKKRFYSAVIMHSLLFLTVYLFEVKPEDRIEIILVFLLQGFQIPFLLKFLARNEITYFTHNRSNLLMSSLLGNGFSIISIGMFQLTGTKIDQSLYTFAFFLLWQVCALMIQEYFYAIFSRKDGEVIELAKNSISELNFIRRCLNLRMYLYVPCLGSLAAFVANPESKEISSIFLGLNAMTLLTFLALPNNKKGFTTVNKVTLLNNFKRLMVISLMIYALIAALLVSGIFIFRGLVALPFFFDVQGVFTILILTLLGVFLLPIVTLENNRVLAGDKRSLPLEIAIGAMICSYPYLAFVQNCSVTFAIAGSFAISYLFWYSIVATNLLKGNHVERRF
jgi:hypothetical protein